MSKLSIIIPCYYNEKNIPVTSAELLRNESSFPAGTQVEYVMVDDGSGDDTLKALKQFQNQCEPGKVKIVKLAGNFGSYNAIQAGMKYATGDCHIVIAADLQDPIELMPEMLRLWQSGFKLVIANRQNREDNIISRVFANRYQRLIKKYALPNLPDGGFDYCLFDKQLKEQVIQLNEKNTNSLYLLLTLNYPYACLPYTRKKREIGKSRWTMKKKIKLFVDSFVSFSYFPLRLITVSGFILGIISLIYAIVVIYARLSGDIQVEGFTAMMLVFLFISAFQMIAIGIIGEYLWRTLEASRKRPPYVVDEVL
jgi:glycosyltransferase involved in cell wall biosynthesis